MSLGHYVPAVLLERRLAARGLAVELLSYERFLSARELDQIDRTRRGYQRDFRLARAGQRLARILQPQLGPAATEELAQRCAACPARRTLVFSGFWVSAVAELAGRGVIDPATVELVHIDSSASPSWRHSSAQHPFRDVWLNAAAEAGVLRQLAAPALAEVPYQERDDRLILHGGGWSLGTYRDAADRLAQDGFRCLVVLPEPAAPDRNAGSADSLWIDPAWRPWSEPPGAPRFPPMGSGDPGLCDDGTGPHHLLLGLAANARAIISKPGGATLCDSLASATPVLFLAPYGPHEADNHALWRKLGFGLFFDEWRAGGHPAASLLACHRALAAARAAVPEYAPW